MWLHSGDFGLSFTFLKELHFENLSFLFVNNIRITIFVFINYSIIKIVTFMINYDGVVFLYTSRSLLLSSRVPLASLSRTSGVSIATPRVITVVQYSLSV